MPKKGINVVLTYKSNEQAANAVVAEIENSGVSALALQLDVSDHNKYADFFSNELSPKLQERFHASKFDFLINNAGTGLSTPFTETTVSQFEDLFNIHLKAGYFFTHQGLVPEYECYEICEDAWRNYIKISLFDLITTGKGEPNPKEKDGFNAEIVQKWKLK